MAVSGWLSSWASVEATSPSMVSRALWASVSTSRRSRSSSRRRSVMSMMEPIQPIWRPPASTSGDSNTITSSMRPEACRQRDS